MKPLTEYTRGFERSSWTIVGAIAGVLSGVLLGIFAQVETAVSVTAGFAVTIVFMQVGEIAQRDRTADILGPYYELRRDRDLQYYMEELIKSWLMWGIRCKGPASCPAYHLWGCATDFACEKA